MTETRCAHGYWLPEYCEVCTPAAAPTPYAPCGLAVKVWTAYPPPLVVCGLLKGHTNQHRGIYAHGGVAAVVDWSVDGPAAAPTPVEPCYGEAGFCYIHRRLVRFCRKEGLAIREPFDKLCDPVPAAPAESRGVERAQPVESELAICGCGHLKAIHWHRKDAGELRVRVEECAEPNCTCRKYVPAARSVEGPQETSSSPQGDSGAGGSVPQSLPDVYGGAVQPKRSEITEPFASGHSFSVAETLKPTPAPCTAPVEGVERVTDDWPAETIPERYAKDFKDASGWHNGSYIQQLHRELGNAETRIEVLEAALDIATKSGELSKYISGKVRAALAAPSGEKEKV